MSEWSDFKEAVREFGWPMFAAYVLVGVLLVVAIRLIGA